MDHIKSIPWSVELEKLYIYIHTHTSFNLCCVMAVTAIAPPLYITEGMLITLFGCCRLLDAFRSAETGMDNQTRGMMHAVSATLAVLRGRLEQLANGTYIYIVSGTFSETGR